ncbi:MAG TPA: NnrS family protein [Alphaproteobacteria bacterium]|nr:NnrS family protein [Alphaproteobacteria bacterium]
MQSTFWSLGFRPFFLAAGAWACLAMAAWIGVLLGWPAPPTHFPPGIWHAHEMIFGYAAAAIAGFALTAVPEWTSRPALRGGALAGLFVLWIVGRLAVAGSALTGPLAAAVADCAFLLVLAAFVAREVVVSGNRRNLVVPLAFAVLFCANVMVHVGGGWEGPGLRLGLAVIVLLIALIGGRITPAFTGNWLKRRGADSLPAAQGPIDIVALLAGAIALAAWFAVPDHAATAILLIAAGALHAIRLARWRGLDTGAEALVWILHLGYAWVPVGLIALGAAHWISALAGGAAVHALATGAVGTMTIAVMTRATLGHSGRELTAGGATIAAYLLVLAAGVLRVAAAFGAGLEMPMILAAGGCWIAGFGLFVIVYAPMHLGIGGTEEHPAHG